MHLTYCSCNGSNTIGKQYCLCSGVISVCSFFPFPLPPSPFPLQYNRHCYIACAISRNLLVLLLVQYTLGNTFDNIAWWKVRSGIIRLIYLVGNEFSVPSLPFPPPFPSKGINLIIPLRTSYEICVL